MSHLQRQLRGGDVPLHVTMRVVEGLPTLREHILSRVVQGALADARAARSAPTFRVVHYTIQSNHLHLVVEADDATALARGAGGLATRIARRINRALGRRGRVFADRFHARELRTPTEVAHALGYVLENVFKHAGAPRRGGVDPLSSAATLAGAPDAAVSPPQSWLARIGWTRAAPPHRRGPAL